MSHKFERVVVIASATLLAGLVLFLTLLSEPSAPTTARRTIDDPINVDLLSGFNPQTKSTRIDPRGQTKKYRINSINSRGQLIELFGDSITPLPEGVTRVVSPGARIHLAPTRVLEILAQQGTIFAPDNQLRSGKFIGQVVLTLFNASQGQPLEISPQSPDAKLHVYLEDATFDLDLGRIDSDQAVRMTGPRLDFDGTGLSLNYNQRRGRIDRLEITQGRSLRFTPARPAAVPDPGETSLLEISHDATPPSATTKPIHNAGATPTSVVDQSQTHSKLQPNDDGQPVQYYRARFENQVRIQSGYTTIEADRLNVVFSLETHSDQNQIFQELGLGLPPAPSGIVHGYADLAPPLGVQSGSYGASILSSLGNNPALHAMLVRLSSLALAQVDGLNSAQENPTDPMAVEPDNGEVVITWSGRLLIEPEEAPPIDMAGPDDMLVEMVGRPVRITTDRNDVITTTSVDYLASTGRVRMIGTDAYPLQIQSPGMGILRGQRMVLHQNQGMGQIIGAGSLQTYDQNATDPQSQETPPKPDLLITWHDRVDLTFYRRDETPPASAQRNAAGILALKDALFRGSVHAQHPQFDLTSNLMTVALNEPHDVGRQSIDMMTAAGDVQVAVTATADHNPLDIAADQLTVEMSHDTAAVVPSHLTAAGNVIARQPGKTMRAGQLDIDLGVQTDVGAQARLAKRPQPPNNNQPMVLASDQPANPPAPQLQEKHLSFLNQWAVGQPPTTNTTPPAITTPNEVTTATAQTPAPPINKQPQRQLSFAEEWQIESQTPDASQTTEPTPPHPPLQASMNHTVVNHADDEPADLETSVNLSDPAGRIVVRNITARDNVRVELDDLAVQIAADRLVADALGQQIELFGIEDQPARVERRDGSLAGDHIIVNQAGRTAHVAGPGSITFFSRPTHAPTQPSEPFDRDVRVTVNWSQAMHLDDRYGLAQFVGDVQSEARTAHQMTRLSAQDLRLEFTEAPDFSTGVGSAGADTPWGNDEQPSDDDPTDDPLKHIARSGRTIRTVTARDDVEFVSAKWADDQPNGDLETRLRVVGPLLNFDNIREQIQVIGPGRMLLEDYRTRPKEQLRDHNTPAAAFGIDRGGQVMLTGRGATLLRWSGHLMLDAFHNDLRAETAVQMIHRSLDSQLTVQMDCQQLLADLEATGGLGVWFAGEAPQPQLKAVYADEAVRILSDEKIILTDHLEYTAYDQTVLLRADAGRMTQVQERDAPTGLTAQRIRWNLLKNRLEILQPGTTHVPVD